MRFPYDVKYDEQMLRKVMVPNKVGNLIPLSEIADFKDAPGIFSILHLERRRVVTVTANIDQKLTTSLDVAGKISDHYKDIAKKYHGYAISLGGEYEETSKSLSGLFRAFIIAILLIFIILATEFK